MKTLVLNPEGYFILDDQIIKDEVFGKSCLDSMILDNHVLFCEHEGEKALLAPQSYPLVVQDFEITEDKKLKTVFNYGYASTIEVEDLLIDDWSRLTGLTSDKKIPFVFSTKAQEKFLTTAVEPVCEDEFEFNGKSIELENWYVSQKQDEDFWGERYKSDNTPWDLNTFHPAITWVLPRLKLHKARILVPGCGKGHDANEFAKLGHNVTGLDLSAEALNNAKSLYGDNVNFIKGDIFKFANENEDDFDGIFEHTLFCAIEPEKRLKLVRAWHKLLPENGHLMAVFYIPIKRNGPPFGVTEWEVQELLRPYFNISLWGRLKSQESARPMRELFVYAQRRHN